VRREFRRGPKLWFDLPSSAMCLDRHAFETIHLSVKRQNLWKRPTTVSDRFGNPFHQHFLAINAPAFANPLGW
jgi:hypothetical protein